jgi:large subunit ribosomal protein L3
MVGLIGIKVGMTQVFDATGVLTPVTAIKIEPNTVVAEREEEKNGYTAKVLGAVDVRESRISKPYRGQFKDPVTPKRYMVEIRDFDQECAVGDQLGVDIFEGCRFVDICGTSKGKGFQGVIKRHGFSGGRATHGSKFHRVGGSTGQNTYPGHSFKGIKMAGRMGGVRSTTQNLEIVKIDKEKQILLIKGAVPGARDGMVLVTYAKKKEL